MIELPPSNLREYDLIWVQDPALKLEELPELAPRAEGETEAAFGVREKAWQELVREVSTRNLVRYSKAALETGVWDELLEPGVQPTIFRVRQIPGSVWNAIEDWKVNDLVSGASYLTTIFRAAVVGMKHVPSTVRCEFEEHRSPKTGERTGIGKVLKATTTDALHAIHKQIVPELATFIARQRGGPAGN